MSLIALDVAKFRELFPKFGKGNPYTNAFIEARWDIATCVISNEDYGCLSTKCRENVLLYVTAHIIQLENAANGSDGNDKTAQAGVITSATIDKVSVAIQQMPGADKSKFTNWLSQSPFGQNALAILSSNAVGGLYVGGLPERSAFRKVGGVF